MVRDEPPPEVVRALTDARRRAPGNEPWSLERWFEAISHMRRLSAELRLGLHDPDQPNIVDLPYGPCLEGGVAQIGRETVRVLERRPRPKIGDVHIGPCIVYPDAPGELVALEGYLIQSQELPALIVSLEGSDTYILAEVRRFLRDRKRSKVLPRTTGPYSLSRSLRSGHAGARWRRYRIVELVEMLAWKASGHNYTEERLGFWIDNRVLGTSTKMSEAKTVARQAIAALPEILAEVTKERL